MKVKLFTKDGGFVRDGLIPPFDPAPEVITWGSRLFVREDVFNDDPNSIGYVEGMGYPMEVADLFASRLPPSERAQ